MTPNNPNHQQFSSKIQALSRLQNYPALLAEVKARIQSAQYAALRVVNKELIGLYWDIGRLIVERQRNEGWGKSVVEQLSADLRVAFPGIGGFSAQNLWYMRQFFHEYSTSPNLQQLVGEIGWSHNMAILSRCKDTQEREFYLRMTRKFGWSRSVLIHQIDNQSYEKSLLGQTNFDQTLTPTLREQAKLAVKDEYTFDFLELGQQHSERELERALIARIEDFLRAMGGMFAFMGSQYRLQGEISKRGVVDVLRRGVHHGPAHLDLYKTLPTPGNDQAAQAFAHNRFSVTRQVRYSPSSHQSLDLVLLINGLPVLTLELKNSLTRQTVNDAIEQYKTTRNPKELLFQPGRCAAHLAVDDAQVFFCTELKGKASWFLPFNQGHNNGAGNPPNPQGLKTDYLWNTMLEKHSLANIIERFAQVVEEETLDATTHRKKKVRKSIFPRFHQLRTVRALLHRAASDGAGKRYLIQHSAGSGKSNTIAWLAHQLVSLRTQADPLVAQFDSIVVITDRRALDAQIARTLKAYDHVASVLGHSDDAQQLRQYLHQGKKIIVTTVQKFPFILEALDDLSDKRFALLIDEAHSSQGGKITAKMHQALGGKDRAEPEEPLYL